MNNENTTLIEILLKTYPESDRAKIAMAFATAKLTPNDPLIALLIALQSREIQAVLSPVALREVAEQALGRIQAAQNQAINHLELIARRMEVASGERFNLAQASWGFAIISI